MHNTVNLSLILLSKMSKKGLFFFDTKKEIQRSVISLIF